MTAAESMAPTDAPKKPDDLKKKTATAMLWSVLRAGWVNIATFVLFVVLARLLGPTEFGIFALASLFVEFTRIAASAGMGDAVIRQLELDESFADTAFWTTLGLSSAMGAVAFAAAPYYAALVQEQNVTAVVRWLAVLLPLSTLGTVHAARMAREFRHKNLALQSVAASLVSGLVAVAAAYAGWGIWALVVQSAVSAVITVGLAWAMYRWVPRFRFSWAQLKPVLLFNLSMVLTQLMWMMLVRVQDIFISRWYGPTAVGAYRIAWRLIELLGQSVLAPIGQVSLVTLSRLQDDRERFGRTYNRMMAVAGIFVFPLLLGFGALAHEFIPLVFSPQWAASSDIAMVLVLMAVPFVTNFFAGPALAAVNRAGQIVAVAALQLAATVLLTWLLVPYGLVAVAVAYVARAYLTMPYQQWVLMKHGGVSPLSTLKMLLPPLVSAVVMAVAVWLAKPHLLMATGPGWPLIGASVALGAALYALLLLLLARTMLRPLFDLLRSLVKKS